MDSAFKVMIGDAEFNPHESLKQRSQRTKQIVNGNLTAIKPLNQVSPQNNDLSHLNQMQGTHNNNNNNNQPSIMNQLFNMNQQQQQHSIFQPQTNNNYNHQFNNNRHNNNMMNNSNSNMMNNSNSNMMNMYESSPPINNFQTPGKSMLSNSLFDFESSSRNSRQSQNYRYRKESSRSRSRYKSRSRSKYRSRSRSKKQSRIGLYEKYDLGSDYGSDNESSSRNRNSTHGSNVLNDMQTKIVLDTIQEYCPDSAHDLLFEDICNKMEKLEKQGYNLPNGYDKRKHDMNENEMLLYDQTLKKNDQRKKQKATALIKCAANLSQGLFSNLGINFLKTDNLTNRVKEEINKGYFDESLDGIGDSIKDTILDHPVCTSLIAFADLVYDNHNEQLQAELDELEQAEETKYKQPNSNDLRNLNRSQTTKLSGLHNSNQIPFDVPAPNTTSMSKKTHL
jgi:hypothetical protein